MATPSLSALAAAAANAVNAARAAQREGEPLKLPIYSPLPGEQWADSHEYMHLPAVRQWSHPFGSKADPLRQLTELAYAKGGYYPLGRNGIWHAGVHFDAGTAGILDQSFVRCLADGEVVAYRIDSQSPTSEFTVNRQPAQRPFTRNFVLVRHRLQAPKIAGSDDTPPSLTFYSLYMHLQDWSVYQADKSLQRPAFWPPGKFLRVRESVQDHVPGLDGLVWLRTRIGPNGGAIISGLARGTEVTVSGTSSYRKLENLAGPRQLLSDGALQGYVRFSHLAPLDGGEYRATHELEVLASADAHAHRLMKLPLGTVVRLSGEGACRKLEWVNQYVHFDSLLSEPEPQERDRCVVLDEPVPIKAGALIGHLGTYHFCYADEPTRQLHLEAFSGQDVGGFIHFCREWAKRLPASGKTWLQVPKGTPIAPDRADLSAARYPFVDSDTPRSAAELYLPKSLLDGLKPEHKLTIPAKDGRKACTWYRLDNLLHDEHNQLQSGWVKVEADAQWASPWEWPGYDVICNRDTPQRCVAYRQQTTMERLNEQARERYSQMADLSDQGPLRSRLFEIIDRNRDGRMTADELQKALELPAHAQSISRLVIHCENEWHWIPQKWNELDEILGHSPSTPHTNWISGKRRIEQMCWWNDVAGKVGLPVDGRVWHFHPIGFLTSLAKNLGSLERLIRKIGDIISHGEGNYESYNTGTKDVPDGRVGFSFLHPPTGTVTNKTIDEIIDTDELPGTNRNRMFATGKYQTVIATLKTAKRSMGLSGDELYDEHMQERVFSEYLFKKAGGGVLARFVEDGRGSVDDAQYAASKEWASISTPAGRSIYDGRISNGEMSYYSGNANSGNQESTNNLRLLLQKVGLGDY
ncbi:EF-hand domain-containing protein [Pseudomonas knackmussii]|uniref:EF-hand domain-containing protein n=1 Tax=Pseudomonas knackmussii TaxID=65741 RepID=UPI00136395A1|nr:EF-hand domain-containing protein [Pseudomonas knackmussii]